MSNDDFAARLQAAIELRMRRRVQSPVTWEAVFDAIKAARAPQAEPEELPYVPVSALPKVAPEYPKLIVRYDTSGQAQEWVFLDRPSADPSDGRFHSGGWFVRPLKELESLKAANVKQYREPDSFLTRLAAGEE